MHVSVFNYTIVTISHVRNVKTDIQQKTAVRVRQNILQGEKQTTKCVPFIFAEILT